MAHPSDESKQAVGERVVGHGLVRQEGSARVALEVLRMGGEPAHQEHRVAGAVEGKGDVGAVGEPGLRERRQSAGALAAHQRAGALGVARRAHVLRGEPFFGAPATMASAAHASLVAD